MAGENQDETRKTGVARYPKDMETYGLHSDEPGHRYRKPDQTIFEQIRGMLEGDPTLDSDRIRVGVDEGRVVLAGEVDSAYTKETVESMVRNIPGVLGLENRLESPDDKPRAGEWSGSTGIQGTLSRTNRGA